MGNYFTRKYFQTIKTGIGIEDRLHLRAAEIKGRTWYIISSRLAPINPNDNPGILFFNTLFNYIAI